MYCLPFQFDKNDVFHEEGDETQQCACVVDWWACKSLGRISYQNARFYNGWLTQATVKMSFAQDSGFPCFKGGARTIQNLRKRFHLSLTEEVWFSVLIFYFKCTIFRCYRCNIVVWCFLSAMRILGAFFDQQQLGCMANKAVWLLSEGFERNIVRLVFVDIHMVLSGKASSVSVWSKVHMRAGRVFIGGEKRLAYSGFVLFFWVRNL